MSGSVRTWLAIFSDSRAKVGKSWPTTLMPTGVLMPVVSMSIRVLMGMVQALLTPGNFTTSSSPGTWTPPGSFHP